MLERKHAIVEATPSAAGRADIRREQLLVKEISSVAIRINRLTKANSEAVAEGNKQVIDWERDIALIIYQGEPFVHELLSVHRELTEVLPIAGRLVERQKLEGRVPFITPEQFAELSRLSSFDQKVNGMPLLDIEQMELDKNGELSLADIKRINRFFHTPFSQVFKASLAGFNKGVKGFVYEGAVAKQHAVIFLIQSLARPEKRIVVPANLLPLQRRLIAYFDWYTNAMLNFDLDAVDNDMFIKALAWNRPWLPQMLGVYIPAKLGITPSSTFKLFETRGRVSHIPMFSWNRLAASLKSSTQNAYRVNAFAPDLSKYQLYNSEADERAEGLLRRYYENRGLTEEEFTQASQECESLTQRLVRDYFKALLQDVYRSSRKRIEISLPEDFPFSKVILTSQNRETLVLILTSPDEEDHLTLEVTKKRGIFGLPPKLTANDPSLTSVVLRDVLFPVLVYAKSKYPNLEPRKKAAGIINTVVTLVPPSHAKNPSDIPREPEEKKREKPKLRVLTPIGQILQHEPELPNVNEQPKRKFVVFHSRRDVAKFLGRKPEDVIVTRVMRKIRDFEYGITSAKILENVFGLWEMRSGDYRIVLHHTDNRFFSLFAIDHRSRIFGRKGVHPGRV